MLLRESSILSNQSLNLGVATGAAGEVGIDHEKELLLVAEAVYLGDPIALTGMREAVQPVLGIQGLVDAITIAAGFNGITKIANATGLPLDRATVDRTQEMRSETGIDDYSEASKSSMFDDC